MFASMPRIKVRRVADAAPLLSPVLPPDGRQSEASLAIRRGVCRRLRAEGYTVAAELALPTGRRADLAALSRTGEIAIIEVKSSVEDFRADGKWADYLAFADLFYFATGPHVPTDIFPADVGLIVADPYGAEVLRPALAEKIAAATRKQMLIRLARAAMERLYELEDPEARRHSQ